MGTDHTDMSETNPGDTGNESTGGYPVSYPMSYTVIDNLERQRFELRIGDEVVSYAQYHRDGNIVTVPLVFTSPTHRGHGHAGTLMDGMLNQIRSNDEQIVPICPFAVAHIRANEEHQDLLASR